GRAGARQRADASAHELRRGVDDRDPRGLRAGAQRPHAPLHELTRKGVREMQKEMIVSSNGHETMVAILEDDLVAEIFVERERHRGVVGNVYKGRVSKVLPGMQSSFIDLGLERDGFLYVADVIDTLVEFDKLAGDDDEEGGGNANGNGSKPRPERDRQDRPQQK